MKDTNGEQHSPVFYSLLEDERLTITHAVLYGLVHSLTRRGTQDCYAKNEHFCKLLSVKERTMSGLLEKLEDCGYIERRFVYSGKKITKRYIRLCSMLSDAYKDDLACSQMHTQHAIESTHSMLSDAELIDKGIYKGIDNYMGDKSPELPKKKVVSKVIRFKEPTLEEVSDYCRKERNNTIDAQNFIDFYTSKGWKVGNTKMKDWQASVRTWETNDKKRNAQNANKQNAKSEYASLNSDYNKSTGLV